MEDLYENGNRQPMILAFDEFQYAKTFEHGKDIKDPKSKIIWELLDSGKFMISRYNGDFARLIELKQKLKYALKQGVKVQGGKVIFKKNLYNEIVDWEEYYGKKRKRRGSSQRKSKELLFYPEYEYDLLFELNKEKFFPSYNVKEVLLKLNGEETIKLLDEIIEIALSPITIDCSKSIIFILGNLDAAYTMSNNYNADMEADEFHKQSLKINISDIKNTLRHKFRNEHIARLGNNHIIYPAFSRASFKKIIDLELAKITDKIKKSYHIRLIFSKSVKQLIYNEGVYPTQGTRPIYTTIHQLISSKLGNVITQIYLNRLDVDFILLKTEKNLIFFDYYCDKKLIYTYSEKLILTLTKLRKNKNDDMQAITAVHESGHAVLTAILLQVLPEIIYSITSGSESNGFIFSKYHWNYTSRKEIIPRVAVMLGGYVAEELLFGKENLTTGTASDINKVTNFLSEMYKNSGMGSLPISYSIPVAGTEYSYHNYKPIEKEIKYTMEKGLELAKKTLQKENRLLLKMADYLSDNRMLKKEAIEKMVNNYATTPVNFISNGAFLFYRKHLKKLLANTSSHVNSSISKAICLNKESARNKELTN